METQKLNEELGNKEAEKDSKTEITPENTSIQETENSDENQAGIAEQKNEIQEKASEKDQSTEKPETTESDEKVVSDIVNEVTSDKTQEKASEKDQDIEKSETIENEAKVVSDIVDEVTSDKTQEKASEKDQDIEKSETIDSEEKATSVIVEEVVTDKTKDVVEEQIVPEFELDVDIATLSNSEIVELLKKMVIQDNIIKFRDQFENIKIQFYKNHKAEVAKLEKKYISEGGDPEAFVAPEDLLEKEFKVLFGIYKSKKSDYNRKSEDNKKTNLQEKRQIIEDIRDLVNRKESINKTFQDFRELQKKWHEIGIVPQSEVNNLWETYHHNIEKFYDYIKINKELRDLDLKKNQGLKIDLCEKAELLLLEPIVTKAFSELQILHEKWREIGPVPRDNKEELWERFREATAKINKKHQEYYQGLKEEQILNLKQKEAICEKVEDILNLQLRKHKKWEEKAHDIMEMQKIWKTVGFAPKKENSKVYKQFKVACDAFGNSKRDFFEDLKKEQDNNLQTKLDLCVQAESLKDSEEWKKTTEDLINLQKNWKEIGPVPRKNSDEVWQRFRIACDTYFNRKKEFFSKVDQNQEENHKLKLELIEKINAFEASDNQEKDLKQLMDFQNEWTKIGHIPIKKKEEVLKMYRNTLNEKFDLINIDENKRNLMKFRNKVDSIASSPRNRNKINVERSKIYSKIKELENEIALYENNIGFFAKSKNANELVAGVKKNIQNAKDSIELLNKKLSMIENLDD